MLTNWTRADFLVERNFGNPVLDDNSRMLLLPSVKTLLQQAHALARQDLPSAAEAAYRQVLAIDADEATALAALGQLAINRGALQDAAVLFAAAAKAAPYDPQHLLDQAFALLGDEQFDAARSVLQQTVASHPDCFNGWLMMGQVCDVLGDAGGALRAFHQAVMRAQRAGRWCDEASTPPEILDTVLQAIEQVRRGRRELCFGSYDCVRQQHGSAALRRVDRALTSYLKEDPITPNSPHQRPRFFYFPDLPPGPYHDPLLQPFAERLLAAYPDIRTEALRTLAEDSRFEDFIRLRDNVKVEDYLRGHGRPPAWQAFFFYRHGKRYDDHHSRCPRTSEALERIDLCRIADEAPEICYSVLTPGSDILPHHGVSNVRLVMHLPLLVPPDCALNVFGGGEHHWREGELMMFDDTYRHEAWNRSNITRVVLLMDCWNPHLDPVEREAVRLLIETLGEMGRAGTPRPT